MDNFYNPHELARNLTTQVTYCTGTLNAKTRHNPRYVLDKKLKKGEAIARYSENVIVGKWKDKRDILFISTEHNGELIAYVDKRNRSREKSSAIFYYNKHMSSVDRQD